METKLTKIFDNSQGFKKCSPKKFIDEISKNKHILMFYEEPEYSRILEYKFIKNGLKKGEKCLYCVGEDDDVELTYQGMNDFGIDISSYKEKGLLKIIPTVDPMTIPKSPEEFFKIILKEVESFESIRVVGRWITKSTNETRVKADLAIEEYFHSNFDKIPGILLCSYDITAIDENDLKKYLKKFMGCHHSAIFAPSLDSGIAFDMK
ncbi:MAG: MEDS domain-containing protein [Nitrosopumilus sp.]|nr:MEDS domain-containing protein [Nitrosopumilus sp.]